LPWRVQGRQWCSRPGTARLSSRSRSQPLHCRALSTGDRPDPHWRVRTRACACRSKASPARRAARRSLPFVHRRGPQAQRLPTQDGPCAVHQHRTDPAARSKTGQALRRAPGMLPYRARSSARRTSSTRAASQRRPPSPASPSSTASASRPMYRRSVCAARRTQSARAPRAVGQRRAEALPGRWDAAAPRLAAVRGARRVPVRERPRDSGCARRASPGTATAGQSGSAARAAPAQRRQPSRPCCDRAAQRGGARVPVARRGAPASAGPRACACAARSYADRPPSSATPRSKPAAAASAAAPRASASPSARHTSSQSRPGAGAAGKRAGQAAQRARSTPATSPAARGPAAGDLADVHASGLLVARVGGHTADSRGAPTRSPTAGRGLTPPPRARGRARPNARGWAGVLAVGPAHPAGGRRPAGLRAGAPARRPWRCARPAPRVAAAASRPAAQPAALWLCCL